MDEFISPTDLMETSIGFSEWCIQNGFKPVNKNGCVRWKHKDYPFGYMYTETLYNKYRKTRVEKLKNKHYGN